MTPKQTDLSAGAIAEVVTALNASEMMKPVSNRTAWDAAKIITSLVEKISGAEELLSAAVILTATGKGLTPEETISLHSMLDVRDNEPHITTGKIAAALVEANANCMNLTAECDLLNKIDALMQKVRADDARRIQALMQLAEVAFSEGQTAKFGTPWADSKAYSLLRLKMPPPQILLTHPQTKETNHVESR